MILPADALSWADVLRRALLLGFTEYQGVREYRPADAPWWDLKERIEQAEKRECLPRRAPHRVWYRVNELAGTIEAIRPDAIAPAWETDVTLRHGHGYCWSWMIEEHRQQKERDQKKALDATA